MANMESIIKAELEKRFSESKDNTITISMKTDGTELKLEACADGFIPNNLDSTDYIMVYGNGCAIWMSGSPKQVIKNLAEYDLIKAEFEEQLRKITAFAEAHKDEKRGDSEAWDWFSDWHKDLFGYRPRGSWSVPREYRAA